ncbi:metal ABC transporter solute-binding protein, Zn/Mn family [Maridesulfovibrio zosterae]|uniref:metal ABC transporter solute-binding protein, Zn/Mn family n=1 Tax=Maridesulfovibrio zosterae TaxID=82171 RepID=UPI0003FB373E|nr:zinc ABC transporter substrate-binding protein [Maridesulfovibrio zosterae]
MRKIKLQAGFILAIIFSCTAALATPLQITVSIAPQEYFVKKIGADLVNINLMVRSGSSPATYEPQPRQMAQLSKADLYFAIGVPFERAWLPRFKSANKKLEIINLGDSVTHIHMQDHIHSEESTHEHGSQEQHNSENFIADPHVWLAPQLVRIMCIEIRDSLITKDPANADTYRKNYLEFAQEINQLDTKLLKLFSRSTKNKRFMVYHPSWGYFAASYGLTQIPIELEGKEPSPKELAQLIKFAKKESVAAIFVQPQFSQKSARAIAHSIDAQVITVDPLASDWATNLEKAAQAFLKDLK